MKGVSEMRLDQGGAGSVNESVDIVPKQPNALSMALKNRRLVKAQKRRLADSNSPQDQPQAIENPSPEEE